MIDVVLDSNEVAMAMFLGERRYTQSRESGYKSRIESSIEKDQDGCIGEITVAKALDRYWTGLAKRTHGDVGPYHVRFTDLERGKLIVRPEDTKVGDDEPYVLVVGHYDEQNAWCKIVGGCRRRMAYGYDLVDPGDRGHPCWMIPQRDLYLLTVDGHKFKGRSLVGEAGQVPVSP